MLASRNLDDQTLEEIMDFVLGRLPWLCPAWTDYNAHDPGITILELIAWYKEMQQFHVNTVTDGLRRKILKLAGILPGPSRAARCFIEMPPGAPARPALSRLSTAEGISVELLEAAQAGPELAAVYLEWAGGFADVGDLLGQPDISVAPFCQDGAAAELLLGFRGGAGRLRLWFEVEDKNPVRRNPFPPNGGLAPRQVQWSFEPLGPAAPVLDETHGLSQSGFVELDLPPEWPPTSVKDGGEALRFLRLRLTDPGCEEQVRLKAVRTGRYQAAQQQTLSRVEALTLEQGPAVPLGGLLLADAWDLFAFLREEAGLRHVQLQQGPEGLWAADTQGAAQDGRPNFFVVTADPARGLVFDADGLPNMTVRLPIGEGRVLPEPLGLICDTLYGDGQVRPAFWRPVEDLAACGPRDRVFQLDAEKALLLFGDGEHGAIVPRGEGAILLAPCVISLCEGGNIPEGHLFFEEDGLAAANTPGQGGRAAETTGEAGRALLARLENPWKCVSLGDYERAALATPGLRVAAAKAVANYDPQEPTGNSSIPVVTVVVIPYSGEARPMPDTRFLDAVRARLDALRPVCTKVKAVAPRYVPLGVSAQIRGSLQLRPALRQAAADYLSGCGIGSPVIRGDLLAALMRVEGVYKVERLTFHLFTADSFLTPGADVILPRNGVAFLKELDLELNEGK
jgi:hypothetical protein